MKLAFHALLLLLAPPVAWSKWLIVSSPSTGIIHYSEALGAAAKATLDGSGAKQKMVLKNLTLTGQVTKPMGLAVDDLRSILYVADPGANAIVGFQMVQVAEGSGYVLAVEPARTIVSGVEAHWVAVDSLGTLFFTDTGDSAIWSVPAETAMKRIKGSSPVVATTQAPPAEGATAVAPAAGSPVQLYTGASLDKVKSPQGLAVDNFNVFWANGDSGTTVGTILQGREDPPDDQAVRDAQVSQLSSNIQVAYGVCLSSSRIFYTEDGKVYSIRKKGGSAPTTVSSRLQSPKGCAYDGDGTIYVADKGKGQVFSFSGGSSMKMVERPLTPELVVTDAYGLAMYHGTHKSAAFQVSAAIAVLLSVLSLALA